MSPCLQQIPVYYVRLYIASPTCTVPGVSDNVFVCLYLKSRVSKYNVCLHIYIPCLQKILAICTYIWDPLNIQSPESPTSFCMFTSKCPPRIHTMCIQYTRLGFFVFISMFMYWSLLITASEQLKCTFWRHAQANGWKDEQREKERERIGL